MWCLLWLIYFLYYYKEKIIPRGVGAWGSIFKNQLKKLRRLSRRASHTSARFFIHGFIHGLPRDSRTTMHNLILVIPSLFRTRSNWPISERSGPWVPWRDSLPWLFFSASFKRTAYGPGQVAMIGFNLEPADRRSSLKSD